MNAIAAFGLYLAVAVILLAVFVFAYSRVTPYDDFALIRQNNIGAAIILSGAIFGFTLPLVACIFFTHSLAEMAKWALITGIVQLAFIGILRRTAGSVSEGHCAPAIFIGATAVAIGMLNAVCISY
jgi:putative membrane protein